MRITEMRQRRIRRQKRVRAKIRGTNERPRLSIFRSHKHMYFQMIDDVSGKTLLWASDRELKGMRSKNKKEMAGAVGALIAGKAKEKKINRVIFDRGRYKYHGLIREAAEGARRAGLQF